MGNHWFGVEICGHHDRKFEVSPPQIIPLWWFVGTMGPSSDQAGWGSSWLPGETDDSMREHKALCSHQHFLILSLALCMANHSYTSAHKSLFSYYNKLALDCRLSCLLITLETCILPSRPHGKLDFFSPSPVVRVRQIIVDWMTTFPQTSLNIPCEALLLFSGQSTR